MDHSDKTMATMLALSYQYDAIQYKYKVMIEEELNKRKYEWCKRHDAEIVILTDYTDLHHGKIPNPKYHGHGFNKGDIVHVTKVNNTIYPNDSFQVQATNPISRRSWTLLSYEFEIYNPELNNIKKKAYSEILKNLNNNG